MQGQGQQQQQAMTRARSVLPVAQMSASLQQILKMHKAINEYQIYPSVELWKYILLS
jgi:hypothetical protein